MQAEPCYGYLGGSFVPLVVVTSFVAMQEPDDATMGVKPLPTWT
jgi:hypothetical protein